MEATTDESRRTTAAAVVSPPPRRCIPDHPPYAEMVQVALRSLEEDGGSTEDSLSGYIRSAFTGLPPAHPRLLPYYLRKLLAAGELSVPSPGRYALPTYHKPDNPNPNPIPNPNPNPTPTDNPIPIPNTNLNPPADNLPSSPAAGPRRRGRPRKTPASPAVDPAAPRCHLLPPAPADSIQSPPPRRGRGRPRLNGNRGQPRPNANSIGEPTDQRAPPASDDERMPRPRLILRLQRKPTTPAAVDATTAAVGHWCCLKDCGKGDCTSLLESDRRPLSEIGALEEPSKEPPELKREPLPAITAPINDHQSNNWSSSNQNEESLPPDPNGKPLEPASVRPEANLESSSSAPMRPEYTEEMSSTGALAPVKAPVVTGEKKEYSGSNRRKSQVKRRRLWFEG